MSHSIPEETSDKVLPGIEPDLSQLPQLPPGVSIPAPGKTPRRKTRWADAIDVIFEKDPACSNVFEALIYPGLWAIIYHRIAHALYKAHIPFSAAPDLAICPIHYRWHRDLSWSEDWETLFHRPRRRYRDWGDHRDWQQRNAVSPGDFGRDRLVEAGPGRLQKRHPTIEDDVTIGVGAAILGPITIGRGSKIGAMALVLESVSPNSVVAAKPAELLVKGGETLEKHQELTQGWSGEMDYQI